MTLEPSQRCDNDRAARAHGMLCNFSSLLARFSAADRGATSIEYALIATILSISIIAMLQGFQTNLNAIFSNVATNFSN